MDEYEKINDVFNLKPGNDVNFLGLNWKFLLPDEVVESDIIFTPLLLCDGKIDANYIAKAYKACEFKIIISCQRDEELETRPPRGDMSILEWGKVPKRKYVHKGLKGVIGIIFAKRYLDGIYISITCASTYENRKIVPTKLGLILRTTMLNYARNHLNITNAYNHAANKELLKYYRKLGWILGNQACETPDAISDQFERIGSEDIDKLLESYDVSLIITKEGYPMKLCNYNTTKMIANTIRDFMAVKDNIDRLFIKYPGMCLSKDNFSEYLKDKYDETENRRYNETYDIKQSFEEE
jgi:hypothetical protein